MYTLVILIYCIVTVPTDFFGQARGADKIALAIDLSFPAATVRPTASFGVSKIQNLRDLGNK